MEYDQFIESKSHIGDMHGFDPIVMPDYLFDFQVKVTEWALRKGRAALFEDCGMGKTIQELVWADNVVRKTNGNVLIVTPLAVSHQTMLEADRFGIEASRSKEGELKTNIVITNYESLKHFSESDFVGMVLDESSILKSFDGATRVAVTRFMRKIPYRLLATATAAPNDHIELGSSSEALGELGYMDMLNRFFKNDANNSAIGRAYGEQLKWRFKGHAEEHFWRWVTSWARALRKPSDIGCDDGDFNLPPKIENEHIVEASTLAPGQLFSLPAVGLKEQREERRRTITERCEKVSELVTSRDGQSLSWCHLNDEGDLLEKMIPGSVQVSGRDKDDAKEEKLMAFASGEIDKLITKPKIGAWGLNFQNCSHSTFFPSHSFEQKYQSIRRFWRFGQKKTVEIDIVATGGEAGVLKNLQRKADQADRMFDALVEFMNDSLSIDRRSEFTTKEEMPKWL
ncbi:MAG: helicase [Geminicoccaceae bacterium]